MLQIAASDLATNCSKMHPAETSLYARRTHSSLA
jgi:hypothetical protein